jgi:uncharacterized protein
LLHNVSLLHKIAINLHNKINRMVRYILKLLFVFIVVSSCKAQVKPPVLPGQPDGNTLLWEVSGNKLAKPSYIFGTFHLMCKEDIKFSNALKQAVLYSDLMYMELDMDDPATMLGGLIFMNMKDGKKLKDLYTPAEYARVESFFKDSLKMGLTFIERMKPSMAGALLYPKMMPCKTASGVEEQLMKLAKQDKKEIKGLETMEFQASVFDSIPYDKQAQELLKTIDSLQQYKKYFDTMLSVYKSQRINEIEEMFNDEAFGMMENPDVLLYNRNRNWVKQLKTIMKKQSIFAGVGAGHLVGTQGLIELLRKEGYTVRPIAN